MYEDEYDNLESVPAEVKHLYKVSSDGKAVLIKASEIKTVQDVTNVQEGLRKEREDHKATKRKLASFGDLDPVEVRTQLDEIEELRVAATGAIDDTKINQIVETRLKTRIAPLERQINTITQERDALNTEVTDLKVNNKRRTIRDVISKATLKAQVRDTAREDVVLIGEAIFEQNELGEVVTKEAPGIIPGLSPEVWLTEAKANRPHWWPESEGAGATGGRGGNNGSNPFSASAWNLTEQGKLVNSNRAKAEQLAKAAGTTIGGPKPAPRK